MLSKVRAKNFSDVKVGGDIVSLYNKLSPFEAHMPGHNYTGPGTNLLLNIEKGLKPVNSVDNGALFHDIAYHENKDLATRHLADAELERKTSQINTGEAFLVNSVMKIKRKLGLGLVDNFKNFLEITENSVANKPEKNRISLSDRHLEFLRMYCDRVGDLSVNIVK